MQTTTSNMPAPCKATAIPATELSADLIDRWNRLQLGNPALESPFFNPALTQAVAAERRNIEVAVIESNQEIIGFLPFFRSRRIIAAPFAGAFTDFQGIVTKPDATLDLRRVLEGSRLAAWRFDHLIAGNDSLSRSQWALFDSPYMDLSQGFDAYRESCRAHGGKELSEVLRKSRKVEREVAPVRFEAETANCRILDTLIAWKQQQLHSHRLTDCFRPAWVQPMLNRILHTRGEYFRPMLSVLYVGDEPAAINFGLRCRHVLHGWITAFNPRFHKYSPGLMLIVKLAQHAESIGIVRIDMGRGDQGFKRRLASGVTRVAEGAVDRRLVAGMMQQSWSSAKQLIRGTLLRRPAQQLLRQMRFVGGVLSQPLDSGR